ncbi:TIGR02265 family protein [Myxococcus sp. K15C18031901]|uniref:TIGR02265 family protein n=1 Tax=Myxococcus dinghuensis TaxID=2906761 RepID=UPI0020A7D41D|nr:TIGR02265 family protein [Myxococcus dinghuensis]MCP3103060.1 TIGR02265 family protein [Myxococcus dinghuensis]
MDRGTWNSPADVQRELEARLALVQSSEHIRGMHYAAVLDTVRFLGGEQAVQSILAEGDFPADLDPTELYPVPPFLRVFFAAVKLLSPQLGGAEEAMRQIGVQGTLAFVRSMFGTEVRQQVGGDPKQLVNMLPEAYRMAIDFGELQVEWTGSRAGLIHMRRIFTPVSYNEGMLEGALQAVGAQDIRVEGRQTSLLDSEYTLSWDD